jgi:HSP20 family protein
LRQARNETRYIVPSVDIYETGDALVVVADLPGADKDAIDVRVEDDGLTINAHYDLPANISSLS